MTGANRKRTNRRRRSRVEVLGEWSRAGARWAARSVVWLVAAAVVAGVPLAVLYYWDHIAALSFFTVQQVQIEGLAQVERGEVLAALGVEEGASSVFVVDPRGAEGRLAAHPWVRAVRVERSLPNQVRVQVEEREVGGLVMLDQLYIADRDGVPFKPIGLEGGLDGAIVTGVGGSPESLGPEDHDRVREAFALMRAYDQLGLGAYDGLSEVQVDPLVGVTLVTERRFIRVFLGDGRTVERLVRLGEVYAALEARGMSAREIRLDSDRSLRRIAVRLDKGVEAEVN